MIVKAEVKPKQQRMLGSTQARVKVPVPRDRRFLICINPVDESLFAYVYDLTEHRIVYKATSSNRKSVEDIYQEIYKYYKKSETRIVEPESIQDIIFELPTGNKRANLLQHTTKLQEEAKQFPPKTRQESIHIRRVKDTYRFIDKYKVGLNIEVIKSKERNAATVYLYNEEQGIVKGTHMLIYNYDKEKYSYYYMDKHVMTCSDLEEIFK